MPTDRRVAYSIVPPSNGANPGLEVFVSAFLVKKILGKVGAATPIIDLPERVQLFAGPPPVMVMDRRARIVGAPQARPERRSDGADVLAGEAGSAARTHWPAPNGVAPAQGMTLLHRAPVGSASNSGKVAPIPQTPSRGQSCLIRTALNG
jgi:hypothetical protein